MAPRKYLDLQNTGPPQHAPSTKPSHAKWSVAAALVVLLVIGVFGYVTFKPKPVFGIGTAQVVDFGYGTARVTIATLVPVKPGPLVESVRAGIARRAHIQPAAVTISPRSTSGVGVDMAKEPALAAHPHAGSAHEEENQPT